ncbi:A-kinase anchor protein 8-like [Eleutherodactylus coqui]|uniref:A-kinase anchor protein 8-like n=1 Tax=Eleutherodactylus coqui TaxID=57060 RepID=UPI003461B351
MRFESYDYGYDYGQGSYGCLSGTGMTSHNGAAYVGTARVSSYDSTERIICGNSGPERTYMEQHTPHPALPGSSDGGSGSFGSNLWSPPVVGGTRCPATSPQQGPFPDMGGFHNLRVFTGNPYYGGGFRKKIKSQKKKILKKRNRALNRMRTTTENHEDKECGPEGGGRVEELEWSSRTIHSVDHWPGLQVTIFSPWLNGCRCHVHSCTPAWMKACDEDGEDVKQEEKEHIQSTFKKPHKTKNQAMKKIDKRFQFTCSFCKFHTLYDEEMKRHLQSRFHEEVFHYIEEKFSKLVADFLQEEMLHSNKKVEERRGLVEDLNTIIQQINCNQDLTQGLGMDHFLKKVEAAHCVACDKIIPMYCCILQDHIKSPLHKQKCRIMMEHSKEAALHLAETMLNSKQNKRRLEQYMKVVTGCISIPYLQSLIIV